MSMMGALGQLVVSLTANTGSFTEDMGKAAHEARKRMDDIKDAAVKAGAVIAGAMTAASGAIGVGVMSAIERIDAAGEAAERLSMLTSEYQRLQYAAELTGASQESFNTAMAKIGEKLTDAASGGAIATKFFKDLGISVYDAEGNLKTAGNVTLELADKLSTMKGSVAATTLAKEAFGKSGMELIPLLNLEREGIIALAEEGERFGHVMSDDLVNAAGEFGDNMARLGKLGTGFFNLVAANLLPTLVKLQDRFFENERGMNAFSTAANAAGAAIRVLLTGGALLTGVFKAVGEYIGAMGAQVVALFEGDFKGAMLIGQEANNDFLNNVKSTAADITAIWDTSTAKVAEAADKGGQQTASNFVKGLSKVKSETQKTMEAVEKQLQSLASEFATLGMTDTEKQLTKLFDAGASDEQLARAREYLDAIEEYKRRMDASTAAAEAWKTEQERAAQIITESLDPIQKMIKFQDELNTLVARGALSQEDAGQAWEKYKKDLEDSEKKTKDNKTMMEELTLSVQRFGERSSDALADFVTTGKGDFKSLINSFIADLLKLQAMELFKSIFKGGGGSGSGGSSVLGTIMSSIGSFFGGARAIGGGVSAGNTYLVGENGPEQITMGAAGTVSPLGGSNVTVSQSIRIDSRSDQATIFAAMKQAKQEAIVAVREEFRRNGPVSKYA